MDGRRRQQRVYTLDRWLRAGRRVVARAAAAELGVDEKTIRRDLTGVLRDRYRLTVPQLAMGPFTRRATTPRAANPTLAEP